MSEEIVLNLKFLELFNEECFGVASDNGFGRYRGQLYIDVLFDESLDSYNLLNNHIEPQDGVLRFEGIELWTVLLAMTMKIGNKLCQMKK
jgi:hypothetical protein